MEHLVGTVGIDPFRLGVPFVTLGVLWLVFAGAMLLGQNWAWYAALITARFLRSGTCPWERGCQLSILR
jgi:hypothetical protein